MVLLLFTLHVNIWFSNALVALLKTPSPGTMVKSFLFSFKGSNFSQAVTEMNTIKIIKSRLNPQLEIEGFLLTMYDSRLRLANQVYEEVKRHFQELVFTTVVQRNVKVSEAQSHGQPSILFDADSAGSRNHLALAKEIIEKNEK